ncbi:hypothetical protein [Candidatus Palauibacter sp.]|uniref:hypothetical protein n=1 Tax=Candidatus Palauibacter sp. TaxID=3101350 RepID=UPI003AF28AA4
MTPRALSLAACAAVILGACATPFPDGDAESSGETDGGLLPAPVDARYLTHLLFVAADGNAFVGSFDQTARGERLLRHYDVRVAGGGPWESLIQASDTLPVPRAAWRLLPAPGMTVRVGDAGQVVSLGFPGAGAGEQGTVRLVAGEEVSVWTGPTGQRESLGIAVLQTGERSEPGILFFRRAARALSIPGTAAGGETFLFADSLGNGLLIHSGTARQPAVAHTWLHGIETAWGDVTLEPLDPVSGSSWRFDVSGTELRGTLRPVDEDGSVASDAVLMEAILYIGDEELHLTGLSATLPSP